MRLPQRDTLISAAITFGANAFAPNLSYRTRWWARLGLVGSVTFVVSKVLLVVIFIRLAYEMKLRQDRMREMLRERLGRDPTDEDILEFARGTLASS